MTVTRTGRTRGNEQTGGARGPEILPGLAKPVSPHGRITAVSMMKDEGPFVIEWVAHHLAVGFTDFVVYTNDCTDGTDEMLIRMQELGLVQHRENRIPPGLKPQPSALKYAQEEPEVAKADWLLVFDADEFLCIRHGDGRLDGLIDAIEAEGANGMVITWRIFGSGGVVAWSRAPVTEQYLMAAPPMWNKGWGVKTLFRFDPDKWKLGIHRPKFKNKVLDTDFPNQIKWLNGSGREMEDYFKFRGWRSIVRTVGYDWAQMNHYAVKSVDSYAIRRFRGNVNNKKDKYNADYWALQDRNEVRDDTMLRYSAARNRIMAALLSDPVLKRLHEAAVARAEATLAEFRARPEYAAFVEGLREASRVPITQVSAKPPKARDAEAIAAQMSEIEKRAAGKRKKELAKPPEARALLPADLYVRGPVDASAEVALEWHRNHSVELPADPRVFTPAALLLIAEGKFQRNLARNLPQLLPQGGRCLEIGAASGFLGAHLAGARPDAEVTLLEADPGLRAVAARVLARAGDIAGRCRLMPADTAAEAAAEAAGGAALLVLGDPAIGPEAAARLAGAAGAGAVVLTGRLLADRHGEAEAFRAALDGAGYGAALPFDATVAIARARKDFVRKSG